LFLCYVTFRCSDDGEKPQNALQFFPGFQIIKSARHCGKITIFGHNVHADEHGFRSGGMFVYVFLLQYLIISKTLEFDSHKSTAATQHISQCGRDAILHFVAIRDVPLCGVYKLSKKSWRSGQTLSDKLVPNLHDFALDTATSA
jgi:hypothetical protein